MKIVGLRLKLHNEYTEFRALDKYSQLFLGAYLIYSLIAIIYIVRTQNYYELWLMLIVPFCSLPLLFSFLPEVRKYKHIDNFFRDLYENNQEVAFFYLVGLFAITWLGFLWGTDIITLDYDRRITLTLQSITASLAPLAFYIAYKNYARKSGDKLKALIDMPGLSINLAVASPRQITIQNLKDKSLAIKEIALIINNQYKIILKNDMATIKAYDTESFKIEPATYYTGGLLAPIISPKFLTSSKNRAILITTFDNNFFISEPQKYGNVPVSFTKLPLPIPTYDEITIQRLRFIIDNVHSIIWSIYVDHAIIITNKLYTTTKFIWAIKTNDENEIIAVHFCHDDFSQEETKYSVSLVNGTPRYLHHQPDSSFAHEKLLGKTINNRQDLQKITDNFNEYCDDRILTTLEGYDIHPCYIDKGSLPDRNKDTITLQ